MLAARRWIGAASVAMLQTLPAAGQAVPPAGSAPVPRPAVTRLLDIGCMSPRRRKRWRGDAVIDLAITNYRALGPPEIATAIATLAGTVPFLSYEEWRAGTYDDRRPYWDHDEPVAVRAARTAAAEARFPGFRMDSVFGPSYAFIDLPTGRTFDLHDGYRARWLMEAIEGGDVVVPYLTRASDVPSYWIHHSPAPPVTLRFVVFAAGLDPDEVEPALRRRLLVWERLAEEEIDAVIRTYRALAGTP